MRTIAIGLLAGTAMLAGTSAFAADFVAVDDGPMLQPARVVCDATGNCWRTGSRRVIIDNSYGYYPRRFYDDRYYYDNGPGVGVQGPGFSFGFGVGPRHYW